jgi:hypothetical protein
MVTKVEQADGLADDDDLCPRLKANLDGKQEYRTLVVRTRRNVHIIITVLTSKR